MIQRINNSLYRAPETILVLISFALLVLICVLDYLTGYEISLAIFYLIPVCLAAWFIGRNSGIGMALVSAVVWQITNKVAGEEWSSLLIYIWNTGARIVAYSVVAILLYNLRVALEHERNISRTDPLTGVLNRRAFDAVFAEELLRAQRFEHPLTVVYIDLDDFKAMNDRFGHSAGDALIRTVAHTIGSAIRDTDAVARLGGDEFAILFPDTDTAGAEKALTKIREQLRQAMDGPSWQVTLSIGAITYFDLASSTIETILKDVDQVMYRVKRTGKNGMRLDTHTC